MIIDLPPSDRRVLKPLFAGYPYLRGMVASILSGAFGLAYADDANAPRVAFIADPDFAMFAGDPNCEAAREMLASVPKGRRIVIPDEGWKPALESVWRVKLGTHRRCAFRSNSWDTVHLRELSQNIPEGFTLKRISEADIERFDEFYRGFVGYDPAKEALGDFIAFGIECQGRFVCGCYGVPGDGILEVDILTHTDFRRRGLATVASATLIEYCIGNGIYANWDAANPMSVGLALKLGYTEPLYYDAYVP